MVLRCQALKNAEIQRQLCLLFSLKFCTYLLQRSLVLGAL